MTSPSVVYMDHNSPIVEYVPFPNENSSISWWTYSNGRGYDVDKPPGLVSLGLDWHLTRTNGANLTFRVYACGVLVIGFSNSSFDVSIDDQKWLLPAPAQVESSSTGSPLPSLLFQQDGLPCAKHNITISPHPQLVNEVFMFNRLELQVTTGSSTWIELTYQSTDPVVTKIGNWSTEADPYIPSHDNPKPYSLLHGRGWLSMSFSPGIVAVSVNGTTSYGGWINNIVIEPTIPDFTQMYNASSLALNPDVMLFLLTGLDPTESYTVTLSSDGDNQSTWVNTITTYANQEAESTPHPLPRPGNHPNIKLIILIVISCVAFFGALACGYRMFRRRRPYSNVNGQGHGEPRNAFAMTSNPQHALREPPVMPQQSPSTSNQPQDDERITSPVDNSPAVPAASPSISSPSTPSPAAFHLTYLNNVYLTNVVNERTLNSNSYEMTAGTVNGSAGQAMSGGSHQISASTPQDPPNDR